MSEGKAEEPINVCPSRDWYYCQDCKGHNKCDQEPDYPTGNEAE